MVRKIHILLIYKEEESNHRPVSLICVVMLIPIILISAPDVKTTSAASGSPYIYQQKQRMMI